MKILFFASIAEITGAPEINLQGIKNIVDLKQQLIAKFPPLAGLNFSVAINKTIVQGNAELKETDEVAFLPPFSGG